MSTPRIGWLGRYSGTGAWCGGRLRAIVVGLGALSACGIVDTGGSVLVRLENGSQVVFTEATLYTQEGPQTFPDVGIGQATPYLEVSTAYRIATTQVVVERDTLRLQVIDFVGEEPLDTGRYTYVLSVTMFDGQPIDLTQELRKDS